MGKKTTVVILASAMALMSLAPLAAAHLTAPSLFVGGVGPVAYDGTMEQCRKEGSPTLPATECTKTDGMSGTYKGSAGLFVTSSQFPLMIGVSNVAELALLCVGGVNNDQGTTWDAGEPRFCQFTTAPSCDLEFVLGDDLSNEDTVDNDGPNGTGTGTNDAPNNNDGVPDKGKNGNLPDGLFDDGGDFGAVCHTSNGPEDWRFTGCGDAGEKLYANDARLGNTVWVSNECDFLTPVIEEASGNEWFDCAVNDGVLGDEDSVFDIVADGAGGLPGSAQGWYTAMTGSALGSVPDTTFADGGCDDMIHELVVSFIPTAPCEPLVDCDAWATEFVTETVPEFVAGLQAALAEDIPDEPTQSEAICGSDAGPDTANYGWGNAGVANLAPGKALNETGVPTGANCPSTSAQQWGFIRDYVNVKVGVPDAVVGVTTGWMDVR